MKTLINTIGAIAVAGTSMLAAAAPATAGYYRGYHGYWQGGYYPRNHWHRYYGGPRYYGGYGYGYYPGYAYYPGYYGYGYDPGAAVAAGLIGGIFGAIAGTALSHSGHGHYRY